MSIPQLDSCIYTKVHVEVTSFSSYVDLRFFFKSGEILT
jgi:hypothetical protein